jgi:hypothetical protein
MLMGALFLTGCAAPGLSDKQLPLSVAIPRDCENLARAVPHAPVALGKTDAGVAYWAEHDRLDTANDRIVATNTCQARQRKAFGEVKK